MTELVVEKIIEEVTDQIKGLLLDDSPKLKKALSDCVSDDKPVLKLSMAAALERAQIVVVAPKTREAAAGVIGRTPIGALIRRSETSTCGGSAILVN